MVQNIIFYAIAAVMVICAILSVTSKRILRSATYLLFVLIATGALYLQLGYEFLAGVQISVYAGGILVLYVFSILLTSNAGDKEKPKNWKRILSAAAVATAGFALCGYIIFNNVATFKDKYLTSALTAEEINMNKIGMALMGTDKYQYLLPFEVISILLLACIIGGILIARKR
ncbi:MAG: NADH-quinone oxidoreductase subunit J [Prevotellaceae bacterium]|jgi:NADH-quinone oxidoreductase subunit J|nr:NADH-quinone oxidoreductase subunit J [Prevotellaceae bacterium]